MQPDILPYSEQYFEDLTRLDMQSVQGKWIQLRIKKPTLFSRSIVFKNHHTVLAKTGNEVVGYLSGGETAIGINEKITQVFVGYDAKVKNQFRNQGIFKAMTSCMFKYFQEKEIDNAVIVTKANNKSINSIAQKQFIKNWVRNFVYLTIPTSVKVKSISSVGPTDFEITMHDASFLERGEYVKGFDGFQIFNTYKTYELEIVNLPFLIRMGIMSINWFLGYSKFPDASKPMKMATLFNVNKLELPEFKSALKTLKSEGVDYLNICCTKGDFLYNSFNKLAVSTYEYCLVSTVEFADKDLIKLDVRCL